MSALNDILPTSVPKLDVSGGNWVIFSLHFQIVVQGKGLWGHFDGSVPCPKPTTLIALSAPVPALTPASAPPPSLVITKEMVDIWDRDENIAHSLLAQYLPDSTLITVSVHKSVKTMWEMIVREFTYKSTFTQACLCWEFMSMQCPDKGDIQLFLNEL
ncbi:hypothetical protein AN958_08467 [Leucoagaricus sp. SymC.cos]|nr:hypothetical protein AN958_08467 [Leucoagaricus sp. SymC.cos]